MDPIVVAALREHPPFDEMEPEAIAWLGSRLKLAYHPRGEAIVTPEQGPPDRLRILKQGRVQGEVALGPGECFPIGALLGRRAAEYAYRAESDVFCWELAAEDFRALLERSARCRGFFTDRLAMMLGRAQRELRIQAAEASLDGAGMLAPLASALRRAPVSCGAATPLHEAVRRMREERVGSLVIVDAAGVPVGIFTTADLLAHAAARAPMEAPLASRMSRDPVTLEAEAPLAEAAVAMARHGIRHIVVTRDGRLAGVVSERDLFALQRVGLRGTSERIRRAQDGAQLAEAAADIRRLVRQLLAQGMTAEPLTAMTSALNDELTRRAIELAAARHTLPARWCWLALGSEGRVEQTFVTDQDNALLFFPDLFVAGENLEGTRSALVAFADEVNRTLDACGFPLCKGDIMARNPRWCLTLEEWRAVFDGWIRRPGPLAVLHALIFFDFRALAGEARLAGELRDGVLAQTRAGRAFCRALAAAALETRPPLGLLTDFALDELDLKLHGARFFVDAARVLALAAGEPATGTAPRLRAAGEPAAVEAFHFIQLLRLRREGNRLRVAELNAVERRMLKEALRQASTLQDRLRLEYAL